MHFHLFLGFDKAILRMISNDCNEMLVDDSLELNVSLNLKLLIHLKKYYLKMFFLTPTWQF